MDKSDKVLITKADNLESKLEESKIEKEIEIEKNSSLIKDNKNAEESLKNNLEIELSKDNEKQNDQKDLSEEKTNITDVANSTREAE